MFFMKREWLRTTMVENLLSMILQLFKVHFDFELINLTLKEGLFSLPFIQDKFKDFSKKSVFNHCCCCFLLILFNL